MNSISELVEAGHHFIIICEGTCEEVIINKLREGCRFVVPEKRIVAVVRRTSVDVFTERWLNLDYDWPVTILRIADSRSEQFKLKALYSDRFLVKSYYTRPEIEMLTIIREGKYKEYSKVKSHMKPNVYCKQQLGMRDIKRKSFLDKYWKSDGALLDAIEEYRRLSNLKSDELCLADLIQ